MTVYVIHAEGTPFVKIGFTNGPPEKRRAALQTSNPNNLVLLAVARDQPWEVEQALHKEFDGQLVQGEWFRLSDEQRESLRERLLSMPAPLTLSGRALEEERRQKAYERLARNVERRQREVERRQELEMARQANVVFVVSAYRFDQERPRYCRACSDAVNIKVAFLEGCCVLCGRDESGCEFSSNAKRRIDSRCRRPR